MIKLVVSDFDGTLRLKGKNTPDPSVLSKIESIINNGTHFAVSSGRLLQDLETHFVNIAEKMYFISSDGALITHNGITIFQTPFSLNSLAFVFSTHNSDLIRFFSKDTVYALGTSDVSTDAIISKVHEIKEPIYKIISYKSQINGFDSLHSRIHYSGEELTEYVPLFANKGVALGALQRHLGVSLYDTLAMGDRDNDIPMMKNAKYKVSVGNRCEKIYAECDIHVSGPDEILEKVWLQSDFTI